MKTFQISEGDLVIGPGGYQMLEGPEKVRQDLGVAVREPYGIDRFHPRWGTLLPEYVGLPASAHVRALIEGEVARLVRNYSAQQEEYLRRDITRGYKPRFSTNEVVSHVTRIDVEQEQDTFRLRVLLSTHSGETVTLFRTVEG